MGSTQKSEFFPPDFSTQISPVDCTSVYKEKSAESGHLTTDPAPPAASR